MVGASSLPDWLKFLLGEKFFATCIFHKFAKKNEKNIFCLNCCISICPHCLPPHSHHRLLQIRRYVYHDVLRLSDAKKFVNCYLVQTYKTNKEKVVFLRERPRTRPFRDTGNLCISCDRSLRNPFLFCSLSCKVSHLEDTKCRGTDGHFDSIKARNESFSSDLEEEADSPGSMSALSGSITASDGGGCGAASGRNLTCTATTDFVKKKKKRSISVSSLSCRQRCFPAALIDVAAASRRKSVPQRAPLY